jgi:hypothetical protein
LRLRWGTCCCAVVSSRVSRSTSRCFSINRCANIMLCLIRRLLEVGNVADSVENTSVSECGCKWAANRVPGGCAHQQKTTAGEGEEDLVSPNTKKAHHKKKTHTHTSFTAMRMIPSQQLQTRAARDQQIPNTHTNPWQTMALTTHTHTHTHTQKTSWATTHQTSRQQRQRQQHQHQHPSGAPEVEGAPSSAISAIKWACWPDCITATSNSYSNCSYVLSFSWTFSN